MRPAFAWGFTPRDQRTDADVQIAGTSADTRIEIGRLPPDVAPAPRTVNVHAALSALPARAGVPTSRYAQPLGRVDVCAPAGRGPAINEQANPTSMAPPRRPSVLNVLLRPAALGGTADVCYEPEGRRQGNGTSGLPVSYWWPGPTFIGRNSR